MMKKLAFLLMISICFSMLGCGNINEENAAQTTQQPTESIIATDVPAESTTPGTVPTEPSIPLTGENVGNNNSINLLGVATLEEYEKHFAENGGYPDSFITYEELQELGAFKGFVCQSYVVHEDSRQKEYTAYQYSFTVDEARFALRVRPTKYIPEITKELVWEDATDTLVTSDLRINNTEALRGRIMIADTEYRYLLSGQSGKLHAISWIVGETEITISIPSLSDPWPENDPDTLIGRMLTWDTAEEALDELREKIDGKLKGLKYPD